MSDEKKTEEDKPCPFCTPLAGCVSGGIAECVYCGHLLDGGTGSERAQAAAELAEKQKQ